MTITLTDKECDELWAEAEQSKQQNPESDEFIYQVPQQIGTGYVRSMEVHPYLWLSIFDYEYHDRIRFKTLDYNHPLQFCVFLSGITTDESGGKIDQRHTLISGSGIQRGMVLTQVASYKKVPLFKYKGLNFCA